MGYYALLVPAYTGHVNPMAALARALQKRGHRVVLIAPLDAEDQVRQAGLDCIPIAGAELPAGECQRAAAEGGKLTGLKATRWAVSCLARLVRGIQRELPEIHRRERFDGLVMDQIVVGTEGVCEVIGLPLAVACNSLLGHMELAAPPMTFPWPYRRSVLAYARNIAGYAAHNSCGLPVVKAIMPYRLRHRLGPLWMNHGNFLRPSLVQVTPLPAFLDFPRQYLPNHFHYTAPWIEPQAREPSPFPWERLDGRPLIYASLGTLQNRLEHAYAKIVEACAGLDAQLVLALGRKDLNGPQPTYGSAIVVAYAPQVALLKRASLVISHGGLNTTLEALSEGLPLVLLPITNDQPGIAARVKSVGAGEFIPIGKLSAASLSQTIDRVLSTPSYRETARKCAHRMARLDGLSRAAELIDTAFSTGRPVYRAGLNKPGSTAFDDTAPHDRACSNFKS
jgi:UDP:flavonoid glycosyltransferase YjiC (YdhE family)